MRVLKLCKRCGNFKKAKEFYAHKATSDGLFSYCRSCSDKANKLWQQKNADKLRAKRKIYYANNHDRLRAASRAWYLANVKKCKKNRRNKTLASYGLTADSYDAILVKQGGGCGICGRGPGGRWKRFCVDHDHDTGKVRGLLCLACNAGLGKLGDTIDGLQRAITYLRRTA